MSLRHFGAEVTEDRYCALKNGPVASDTYSLMKACDPAQPLETEWVSQDDGELWRELFEKRPDYTFGLIGDPGDDYLSRADVMMLEMAYRKFRASERFEMANDISHIYPEWTRARDSDPEANAVDTDAHDFFYDPETEPDRYFQVDKHTLESARFLLDERRAALEAVGIQP